MSDNKTPDINRRKFLSGVGTAAVGAAALATPRVNLEAAQAKAPRWAMVMDLRRCIGCRACTVACKSENNVSLGRFRAVIQEKTMGTFPNTKKEFLPLMCNHCEGNEKDGVPP
ncbi:MAG: twin-arginine translocation signal domain-containing protein, partial [Candidatus Thiodiazotropha sp.]